MANMGLAGAHRCGKSTLAKAVAEELEWTFVPSRVTQVYAELGFKVGEPISVADRLKVQNAILDAHIADVSATKGPWIADRTTLDFAAYMLMAGMDDPEHQAAIADYVNRCMMWANRLYGSIILVQPGIAPVVEEGKFPPNTTTQELMNFLLWGMLADNRVNAPTMFLRRESLDLKERVDTVIGLNNMTVANTVAHRQGATIH